MKRRLFTILSAVWLLLLSGCGLVIPAARIHMDQPLGTVYWGPANDGLSAGVTIDRPVVDEKKLGDPPYMPDVVFLYKLRNVSDRPIRILLPTPSDGFAVSDARLTFVPSARLDRLPGPSRMPGPWSVIELGPGQEFSEEYHYRVPKRPYGVAVRFDYHNYAKEVAVRRDGHADTAGDLWTGHVESAILKARIE